MGILDNIKGEIKKSGSNKSKLVFFKEGAKQRLRFLTDMEDGVAVTFHDSFAEGINAMCQEHLGKDCPYCGDEELRTRQQYAWTVFDYEANEEKLFIFPVNNCSPVPALMAMYETYGTLTDRDYTITVTGKQQNKTFSVVPLDKAKFRNKKAKPLSEKTIFKMLGKAFPCDNEDADDDDITPTKSKNKKSSKPAKEVEEENENDYEDMTPKELYALCVEKEIECEKKKTAAYYVNLLEEFDKAQNDWDDDDDDSGDDWGDEGDDDEWDD